MLFAPMSAAQGVVHTLGFNARKFCADKGAWLTYNASGAGTEASPYLICNAAQLAHMTSSGAAMYAHYKLMGDIDLAPYYAAPNAEFQIGYCVPGDCAEWSSARVFAGVFDGNNHTIRNFSFISPGTTGGGFFAGSWYTSKIKNLRLVNATVSGGTMTGALIGAVTSTTVENCIVSGSVTGNGAAVGGIVGSGYHVNIINTSFSGTVNNTSTDTGGAVGAFMESTLSAVRVSGTVTSTATRTGGLVGQIQNTDRPALITNSYNTANVTGTSRVGGLVGVMEVDRSLIYRSYNTGNVSGSSSNVGGIVGRVWGSRVEDSYSTGNVARTSGTGLVGPLVGSLDASGTLTNSYYLSSASCTGTCNSTGSSHANLSDFYNSANAPMSSWDKVNTSADGLNDFWSFNGATHAKLWWEESRTAFPPFPGAGTYTKPYLITTIAQFNKIAQNPRWLGAHFRLDANLDFNAQSFNQIGGMNGAYSGDFNGNNRNISNVTNNLASADYVGIFGLLRGRATVRDLTITAPAITGRSDVGGAIGLSDSSTVTSLKVVGGTVSGSGTFTGGFYGRASKGGVYNSGTSAAVTGSTNTGGFGGGMYAGGMDQCYAKGSVTGLNGVGGFFGRLDSASLNNSYATGSVTATGSAVGGLIGALNWANIYNAYTTSAVTGVNAVGGIVGDLNMATISDVFTTSTVNGTGGTAQVGRTVGVVNTPTITRVYYWSGATCDSTGSGGACSTTNATGSQALSSHFHSSGNQPLSNWDFPGTWTAVGGTFPKLTWEP